MKLIVAVDQNWAIGYQNNLLVRISADLKRFKALTLGHPVLLGRKTLETFPGGRPLPGRPNFILSTDQGYRVEGAEVVHSVAEALQACPDDTFVIGGESVYRALLPYCDTAYVTKIDAAFPADAWFPNLDEQSDWQDKGTVHLSCDGNKTDEPPCLAPCLGFRYDTYVRRRA